MACSGFWIAYLLELPKVHWKKWVSESWVSVWAHILISHFGRKSHEETREYEEDFEITTYTHEPPGAIFWGLLKSGITDRALSSLSQRWAVKSQLLSRQKQAHIPFDNTLARKIDGTDTGVTRLVEGHPENGEDLSRVSRGRDIKFHPHSPINNTGTRSSRELRKKSSAATTHFPRVCQQGIRWCVSLPREPITRIILEPRIAEGVIAGPVLPKSGVPLDKEGIIRKAFFRRGHYRRGHR